ncbi:hypothetical protein GX917_00240 [Candidatus Falkowbacteria bacterium]|jgi:hypothetical protein|nr:hypothetical protein [Candidatus Falkowbacteria bacterium]
MEKLYFDLMPKCSAIASLSPNNKLNALEQAVDILAGKKSLEEKINEEIANFVYNLRNYLIPVKQMEDFKKIKPLAQRKMEKTILQYEGVLIRVPRKLTEKMAEIAFQYSPDMRKIEIKFLQQHSSSYFLARKKISGHMEPAIIMNFFNNLGKEHGRLIVADILIKAEFDIKTEQSIIIINAYKSNIKTPTKKLILDWNHLFIEKGEKVLAVPDTQEYIKLKTIKTA